MRYNYFCCRNPLHVRLEGDRWDGIAVKPAPVTLAAPPPNNLPGVFACPKCPRCRKTMEFCYSGDDPTPPTTPPPVAPPPPALQGGPAPALSGDVSLYSGSGENRGHPNVTWNITRNAQQMDITIKLMLGTKNGRSLGQREGVQVNRSPAEHE
jgi:hypothetical protein